MNKKKTSTILYICVFVFVFVMFALTAYSYYVRVVKPENVNIDVKKFNMLVEFNGPSEINAHNLNDTYEETREFTIKNYSSDTIGKYNIVFEVVTPLSNMVDEDFTYELEGVSDSKDTTNKLVTFNSTPVSVLTKTLGTGTITPGTSHTYKITFKLKNNKYESDSLFSAGIKITNE